MSLLLTIWDVADEDHPTTLFSAVCHLRAVRCVRLSGPALFCRVRAVELEESNSGCRWCAYNASV